MIWKPIPGETASYEINELGEVRSRKSGEWRIMKPILGKLGYYTVAISHHGVSKKKYIHRLLAQAFIPNPLGLPEINHVNGNKADYSLENLEWCTHAKNMGHAVRSGLIKSNGTHKTVKMTNEQIKEAHFCLNGLGWTNQRTADHFSVSCSLISLIRNGYRASVGTGS